MTSASRRQLDQELRLPDQYLSREVPDYYDDDEESYLVRQPDVYGFARTLAQRLGASTLVDIGCGKAAKLLDISAGFDIVGADFGENIEYCRRTHPTHRWEEIELEGIEPSWIAGLPRDSLLICGDVIEHLCDPRPLMSLLRAATDAGMAVVISTPDRGLIYEADQTGPPTLGAHVREWTLAEFAQMLLDRRIPLAAVGHTRPSIGTDEATTILAVAIPGFPPPEPLSVETAGLLSTAYASAERHLRVAADMGFDMVEITDGPLVVRGLEAGEPRGLREATAHQPITCGDGGRGIFPFNLVAFGPNIAADVARRATRRHLAIAATGVDPSSELWADESRRWLLHREHVLSTGFDEANAISDDLGRQLDDHRESSGRAIEDLHSQLADLRTIEHDLRVSSTSIEADLREQLHKAEADLADANVDLARLRAVMDRRRAELTEAAEQRARTMPDVDRSTLTVPAQLAPARLGRAARRRVAPRLAELLHRAAVLPRLGRLRSIADDLATSATPAGSVPEWLFDASYYLRSFPPAATSGVSAAAHYELVGWRFGRSPHPLFESGWYLGNHPDVREAGVDPLRHFAQVGWAFGYDPHPLFSTGWYLEQGPDVAAAGMNPLEHYLRFGWLEGRDPHPLFDTDHYLRVRPDVAAAGVNPLVHYVEHGHREGTSPSTLFDPGYYAGRTPAARSSILPDYWYYLEVGAQLGDITSQWMADAVEPDQVG